LHDDLHRLLGTTGNPKETLTATGSGSYVYVGAYKAFRAELRVGGDITGTNPTLDMRVQTDLDGQGSGTTALTFTQVTTEQVGYVGGTTPRYEVPGSDPLTGVFETGANPYVRADYTIGGTATPTFPGVSVELVPIKGYASRKSGS
jgi:hypothetical protein